MPLIFANVVTLCALIYIAASLVRFLRTSNMKSLLVELLILVVFAVALYASFGYPTIPYIHPAAQAFGQTSSLTFVGALFVFIVLGMLTNYLFYKDTTSFDPATMTKPLLISPIVLLPILGSLDSDIDFGSIQFLSSLLLAFQNGFFWKTVFDKVEKGASRRRVTWSEVLA